MCRGVGVYGRRQLRNRTSGLTLAESWNGKTWAIEATPNPKGAEFSGLYGVSCSSAKVCTAVGYYGNHAGKDIGLAEAWNGKMWAIEAAPIPSGAKLDDRIGVSCTSPTACRAVGSYTDRAGSPRTLGEGWRNGKKWAIDRTANPNGARSSQLHAVSCTSATACTAVGESLRQRRHPRVRWARSGTARSGRYSAFQPKRRGDPHRALGRVVPLSQGVHRRGELLADRLHRGDTR